MTHESPSQFPSLSQNAQTLINLAKREAHTLKQKEVGTEHFLLAAAKGNIFQVTGLEYQTLRDELILSSMASSNLPSWESTMPSVRLGMVIEDAKKECLKNGNSEVTENDLMLALLSQNFCTALTLLKDIGIDTDDLKSQISFRSDES